MPSADTDPATMKVGELKAELKALGVTDLRHCVEKEDLVNELAAARKRRDAEDPIDDGGLRYGRVALAGNTRDPTALVVFSHGLGDTCDGWAAAVPQLAAKVPHALFVLPTAATQRVTLNMGAQMPSWYDIRGLTPDTPEDTDGMRRSAKYIDRLVAQHCQERGIPQDRVVYGGFSQGGCMALFTGLTTRRGAPAGILSLSGYAGSRQWVLEHLRNAAAPIFMAHGTMDPVVPMVMSTLSREGLEKAGCGSLEYKTYPMGHSACEEEMADVASWLARVIPAA